MCIKIKFSGFVLDIICHLTSESKAHKQGVQWCLQENRHGKSNHTLFFATLVGIRLLKVKLNTKSSLFCWWQESINSCCFLMPTFLPPCPFWSGYCGLGLQLIGLIQQRELGFFQIIFSKKLRRNKLYKLANTINRTTKCMKQAISSKPWVSILPAPPAGEVENRNGNPSSIPLAVTCCGK